MPPLVLCAWCTKNGCSRECGQGPERVGPAESDPFIVIEQKRGGGRWEQFGDSSAPDTYGMPRIVELHPPRPANRLTPGAPAA